MGIRHAFRFSGSGRFPAFCSHRPSRSALFAVWWGLAAVLSGCDGRPSSGSAEAERIALGSERLLEDHLHELRGLNVGLVMNASSRLGGAAGSSTLLVDTLLAAGVEVGWLLAPEHGVRGELEAGAKVEAGVDGPTGIPVISLYGARPGTPPELPEELDLLLFDIQDVGARFYTYVSSMGLLMDAAAEAGIPLWVLDRPNPAGGNYVSGWDLEPEHRSFVGLYPMPMVHGMTLGELALLLHAEGHAGRVPDGAEAWEPRVIPMRGWTRDMLWPDTGLEWIPPSPNLPRFENAYVYLGTCLVEGTTLSEGRGTPDPFLLLGSPGTRIEPGEAPPAIPGARVVVETFTPVRIPGKAESPKFMDEPSVGVRIELTDPSRYDPVASGIVLIRWLMERSPDARTLPFLSRLAGTDAAAGILDGSAPDSPPEFDSSAFRERRAPHLLY